MNNIYYGFCSIHHFHGESMRNGGFLGAIVKPRISTKSNSMESFSGCKASFVVGCCGIDFRKKGSQGMSKSGVFASKVESVRENRKSLIFEDSSESCSSSSNVQETMSIKELNKQFMLLQSMVSKGQDPDVSTCRTLIRGFSMKGMTRKVTQMLDILDCLDAVLDVDTYNVLIDGYCKAGEIDNALQALDRMSVVVDPNVDTYNAILLSLCRRGQLQQAMEVLERKLVNKCYPNVVTYNIFIEAICKEKSVEQAMELLDDMRANGCKPNAGTYHALVWGLCGSGRLDEAIKFVNDMPSVYKCHPDVATYDLILSSMCKNGRWVNSERLLDDVPRKGCSPSVDTFNILISCLCRDGLLDRAVYTLEKMEKFDCAPNAFSYNPLLTALCRDENLAVAGEVLNQLRSKGCYPVMSRRRYTVLIDGISRKGKAEEARKLMDEMVEMGLKPYLYASSSLIKRLCRDGNVEEAIKVSIEREQMGYLLDAVIYSSIISSLCKARQTGRAIDFLARMVMSGCKPNEATYATVVEGIALEGFVEEAKELWNELRSRGVVYQASAELGTIEA